MGLFSEGAAAVTGDGAKLAPLSKNRVTAVFDAAGWSYSIDDEGDIRGGWESGSFLFLVDEEVDAILCVRGYWRGRLGEPEYLRALELCNLWNADRLWPRTFVGRDDDGSIRLNAEHTVDYSPGVTDEQLTQHLLCAIGTSMTFFAEVCEAFPEAWAQYQADG
ncbi:YbjN domain-containing protein [Leucobacter sp. NPDC077196]|uniref:YbjN domain-containing protein n=1 Tax=Leucobacter sp. NPDC077196 TaxID=3154959 RepID=UPI00341FD8A0